MGRLLKTQLSADPEIPEIGDSIAAEATVRGVEPLQLAMEALEYRLDVKLLGTENRVSLIPGHTFGGRTGPAPGTDVMIVGKMPTAEEAAKSRLFCGASGKLVSDILRDSGKIKNIDDWYVTNACRFMPPNKVKEVKASWVRESQWLFAQEIHINKPKYMLLMGADAVKSVFGNTAKITQLRGANGLEYKGIKVMVTVHPLAVVVDPQQRPGLQRDLLAFANMVSGQQLKEDKPSYTTLRTEAELKAVVDYLIHQPYQNYGLDCEWGGTDGASAFRTGTLRCIQFSPKPGMAFTVALRSVGMKDLFSPSPKAAIDLLKKLFIRPGVRIGGHNLRSDMKLMLKEGLDVTQQYVDGIDTMLAHHLLHPGEQQGLENLVIKYTGMGRYDLPMEQWKKQNKLNDEKVSKEGYASIPDEMLFLYGAADADAVSRIWPILEKELLETKLGPTYSTYTVDMLGTNGQTQMLTVESLHDVYRLFIHAVQPGLNEIESVGITADKDRLLTLAALFKTKRDEVLLKLRTDAKWPNFNHRATFQVRELLFGEQYANKPGVSARPKGAVSLGLTPVKTTGKPSKDWSILSDADKLTAAPSTDSETLKILAGSNPLAKTLMQVKFVDQIIKNFLRTSDDDVIGEDDAEDEEDNKIKTDRGLLGAIDPDGMVRTNISQLTDTGRYRSSDPNLQNLPKKQDAELRKIFTSDVARLMKTPGWAGMPEQELKDLGLMPATYYNLRSCFVAPEGEVFIEADYKQAELWVLAYLSQDKYLIETLNDGSRDLHSEQAVLGFKLDCQPSEVKRRYPQYRVSAKNVIFGVIYGRGAKALVREAAKEGITLTVEQAKNQIETFFSSYPMVRAYINACKQSIIAPGYVETPFGRRRRFYPTSDRSLLASQERQAVNMPVQGTVAECLTWSILNLMRYRIAHPELKYKLILPVHDAILLTAPEDQKDLIVNEVLPLCMSKLVTIPHINLNLKIDIQVMKRWSEAED
jgi:uracil-DNA glycosylase family 4